VDVHIDDDLGRLSITDEGLARRELLVLDTCLAAGVPLAGYVGGGYHADLGVLAERHMALHRAGVRMWREHGL
jgi:acetoin utilization deacetylase AcuC-like enzyme